MCRDFSYAMGANHSIYRHKTRLFCNSHTRIMLSHGILGHGEDRCARWEHIHSIHPNQAGPLGNKIVAVAGNTEIVLDEDKTPRWFSEQHVKTAIKFGEAARIANHRIRDLLRRTKQYNQIKIGKNESGLWIKRDPRNKYQKRQYAYKGSPLPNSSYIIPPIRIAVSAHKTRESFRKACLAQNIPTRLADAIYSIPADALFGKLNFQSLERFVPKS